MQNNFDIESSCRITNDQVLVNGSLMLTREAGSENWLADIYHAIGMQYPKFFKMDNLCKAGTLGAELLLRDTDLDRENVRTDWAIVLMNSASSLDDDRHYQQTIQDPDNYYPSPAVFVYTLANIVTGEIAIRHKIGGESSFYVLPEFNMDQMTDLTGQAFAATPELKHILCGWADYDNKSCDVQLFHAVRK
ncbi:MAG: hypothetical protein K5636_07000 [Bacteroidales bacterium]|nr:hypothetical protein [Bacteroidales bacterium]